MTIAKQKIDEMLKVRPFEFPMLRAVIRKIPEPRQKEIMGMLVKMLKRSTKDRFDLLFVLLGFGSRALPSLKALLAFKNHEIDFTLFLLAFGPMSERNSTFRRDFAKITVDYILKRKGHPRDLADLEAAYLLQRFSHHPEVCNEIRRLKRKAVGVHASRAARSIRGCSPR